MSELRIFLNIPDVEIIDMKFTSANEYVITVKSKHKSTRCHRCGKLATKPHGYGTEIRLRHVSILDNPVYIIIKPVRYRCLHCEDNPTTTEQPDWYSQRSKFTTAYEKYLMRMLISSTISDVAKKEDLSYEEINGALDRQVSTEVNWKEMRSIDMLGLDEISLKKGYKNFVVIVSTRINNQVSVLAVLCDRKKETVKSFLKLIPQEIRTQIKTVCSDLYEGFINAALEVLGYGVKVVADRFHVAKIYRKGLDSVRKKELKRLRTELSAIEYKELKGSMWALRKKPDVLTTEDNVLLNKLFLLSPKLKEVYEHQNDLTAIFDKKLERDVAGTAIKKWKNKVIQSGLSCFDDFLTILKKHYTCIINYFDNRHSNGFVEGFNNKIKVIKRRCYGIFNIKHLFQRIQLDTRGYDKFARLCTNS